MKNLLILTSLIELSLGIALVILPGEVIKLLFGNSETGSIIVLARFTGIVFVCFSIACFPSKNSSDLNISSPVFRAMFLYNFLAAVYLGYMRFSENFDGVILLPAAILHSIITIYFIYIFQKNKLSA